MVHEIRARSTLIKFCVDVFEYTALPDNPINKHLCGQLIRSVSAPALMYAEANAAESPADFIHKMGMALKEIRESKTCLKIFEARNHDLHPEVLSRLIDESKQLIAIFGASINTARKNIKP